MPLVSTKVTRGRQSSPVPLHAAAAVRVPTCTLDLPSGSVDIETNRKITTPAVIATNRPINVRVLIETSGGMVPARAAG